MDIPERQNKYFKKTKIHKNDGRNFRERLPEGHHVCPNVKVAADDAPL